MLLSNMYMGIIVVMMIYYRKGISDYAVVQHGYGNDTGNDSSNDDILQRKDISETYTINISK